MNTRSTASGAKSTRFITKRRRAKMRFEDRKDAGRQLAERLESYKGRDTVVLALPRGGVVLGYEIAKYLGAPLDLIITRKIGHPMSPEYAICAIAEDGHMICNEAERRGVDEEWFSEESKKEQEEAKRRRKLYLKGKSQNVKGKTVIIVDDGIATGFTMSLAISEAKHGNPEKIVVAVPVAPKETAEEISKEVDKFVALDTPEHYLGAVGAYYVRFEQVSDEEVISLLENRSKNT